MNLTGTIKDKNSTLPSANIYVSDKNGNPLQPLIGTSSSVVDGSYNLGNVPPMAYVTASYVGYKKNTVQIPFIVGGNTPKHDFLLAPDTAELKTFEFIEETEKPVVETKTKNYVPHIIVGSLLLTVVAIIISKNSGGI